MLNIDNRALNIVKYYHTFKEELYMYKQIFDLWLNNADWDPDLKKELISVVNSPDEISDRFYKTLDFGTAGLRGIIGAGTNRMNVYTVGSATQGLAEYVNSVCKNGSVAIAYDSRIKSTLFAKTAAGILAANGIKVYIYDTLMPTPMLSFAVRQLGCNAGIVITASHNPASYNGYKAYGSDGCQIGPDEAKYIMSIIQKNDCFKDIKFTEFEDGIKNGNIEYIKENVIEAYLDAVEKQSVNGGRLDMSKFKVIYTPLHGTGNIPVRKILDRIGIKNVVVVKEQELPDGNFPTAPYPNPELRQTFEIALELAKSENPDILLATDPDADRVGIAVNQNGEFILLTGNDVGVLLLDYILTCRKANGTLPENPVAVKTIVTTELCQKIADDKNCRLINVITGFKFIGNEIALLEEKNQDYRFILGFEESYGYLPGSYVRDKDAVVASMLICEMAAYYKTLGITLCDKLDELYKKYGYYLATQNGYSFEGQAGMQKMSDIMQNIRENPPKEISNSAVISIDDYLTSTTTQISNGATAPITLPKSNVIVLNFDDCSKLVFRPSGTEPKIKVYVETVSNTMASSLSKQKEFVQFAAQLMK